MQVRPARVADAAAISSLILSLREHLTLAPDGQGAEAFLASLAPAPIARLLADPAYRYWVGAIDGAVAAVVALRANSHLYHLFVAAPFQGRGLARQLWELARAQALAAGNPGRFTVNASLFAEPMYRRFGFVPSGPRQEMNGIAFIPMLLSSP